MCTDSTVDIVVVVQGLEKGTSKMWGQAAVHENIEFKIYALFKRIEMIFAENNFSRHPLYIQSNL